MYSYHCALRSSAILYNVFDSYVVIMNNETFNKMEWINVSNVDYFSIICLLILILFFFFFSFFLSILYRSNIEMKNRLNDMGMCCNSVTNKWIKSFQK